MIRLLVPLALGALGTLVVTPAFAGKVKEHDRSVAIPFPGPDGVHNGPLLGVALTGINDALRAHFGAPDGAGILVSGVVDGSAADRAGLVVGDVVYSLGDQLVRDARSLRRAVAENTGQSVQIQIVRDGERRSLTAEIAPAADPGESPFAAGRTTGKVWVYDSDKGELEFDLDQLGDLGQLSEQLGEVFEGPHWQGMQPRDLEDLHRRLDDLEQQLLEMSERFDHATEDIQDRLDGI